MFCTEILRQCLQMSNFSKKEEKLVQVVFLDVYKLKEFKLNSSKLFFFIFQPCHITHCITQVIDALPIHRHRVWNIM